MNTERPTTVPSSWPAEADLAPVIVPRYPAVPNTDAIETVRPVAWGSNPSRVDCNAVRRITKVLGWNDESAESFVSCARGFGKGPRR